MNAKTAKRLRKEANYKPGRKPTKYETTTKGRRGNSTSEVDAADPRYLYRELKKEHKNASR